MLKYNKIISNRKKYTLIQILILKMASIEIKTKEDLINIKN